MTDISTPDGQNKYVQAAMRRSGYGTLDSSLADSLRGVNTRNVGTIAPMNQDVQGYTFFTTPMCNLSAGNVVDRRRLQYLSNPDPRSMACAIKTMLSHHGTNVHYDPANVTSALVDPEYPFIGVMTNTLKDITGWPDFVHTFSNTDEGIAKEVHGFVDSRSEFYSEYTLNASFHRIDGDPVGGLVSALWEYAGHVAYGTMVSWPNMRANRWLDYVFRIYRVVLDETKRYVTKIACTGYCMLEASPEGAIFNQTSEEVQSADNAEISIPIKCYGVRYNDPQIINDFNATVMYACPSMKDNRREADMVLLNEEEVVIMSNYAYPRVTHPTSASRSRLEWWAKYDDYNSIMAQVGVLS